MREPYRTNSRLAKRGLQVECDDGVTLTILFADDDDVVAVEISD